METNFIKIGIDFLNINNMRSFYFEKNDEETYYLYVTWKDGSENNYICTKDEAVEFLYSGKPKIITKLDFDSINKYFDEV